MSNSAATPPWVTELNNRLHERTAHPDEPIPGLAFVWQDRALGDPFPHATRRIASHLRATYEQAGEGGAAVTLFFGPGGALCWTDRDGGAVPFSPVRGRLPQEAELRRRMLASEASKGLCAWLARADAFEWYTKHAAGFAAEVKRAMHAEVVLMPEKSKMVLDDREGAEPGATRKKVLRPAKRGVDEQARAELGRTALDLAGMRLVSTAGKAAHLFMFNPEELGKPGREAGWKKHCDGVLDIFCRAVERCCGVAVKAAEGAITAAGMEGALEGGRSGGDDDRFSQYSWEALPISANRWWNGKGMSGVIERFKQKVAYDSWGAGEFNQNLGCLPFSNGRMVDLETGEWVPLTADHRALHVVPAPWIAGPEDLPPLEPPAEDGWESAEAERAAREHQYEALWHAMDDFVAVFCCELHIADREQRPKTRFMRRLFGYYMTGHRTEDIFASVYGTGGNSKSVFFDILETTFGDFVACCNSQLILVQRNPRGADDATPVDFRLAETGARLCLLDELKHGDQIDAKQLRKRGEQGKGELMRQLFGETERKTIHASTVLSADTEPAIEGGATQPVVRRFRRIVAEARIGDAEQDGDLHYRPEFADPESSEYRGAEWCRTHFPRDKTIKHKLSGTPLARAGVALWIQLGAQDWAAADPASGKEARSVGQWPEEWAQAAKEALDEQDHFEQFLTTRCSHAAQRDVVLVTAPTKLSDFNKAFTDFMRTEHRGVNGGAVKEHLRKRKYEQKNSLCGGETKQKQRWKRPRPTTLLEAAGGPIEDFLYLLPQSFD